jgi:hypothetical protein
MGSTVESFECHPVVAIIQVQWSFCTLFASGDHQHVGVLEHNVFLLEQGF